MPKIYTKMPKFCKQSASEICYLIKILIMRFGLNTFLVSPGFTDADIPLIHTFKRYGAEVIELAIVDPDAVTISKIRTALNAAGMPAPIICGAFGAGRDLRGNTDEVANATSYICQLIDMAHELGSGIVCGPMYSETGRSGPHSPSERDAQLERIANTLKLLCTKAEAADVILALEPLNRFETDCINTIDQALDLIERVGSPALKIHIDTFHMNIEEEDSGAAIRRASKHIGHVHASASHRGLLGQDQVDWDGVFTALSDIEYEGDIVIESFSMDNKAIARAASIWRPLYDSPEQLAVEGLKFLQERVAQLNLIEGQYA